jgi:exonuclease III
MMNTPTSGNKNAAQPPKKPDKPNKPDKTKTEKSQETEQVPQILIPKGSKVIHLVNTRSFVANMASVQTLLKHVNTDICLLTETRFTREMMNSDKRYTIEGYTIFFAGTETRRTGGSGIIFHEGLNFSNEFSKVFHGPRRCRQKGESLFMVTEIIWVHQISIQHDLSEITYLTIYRSPSGRVKDFLDAFRKLLESIAFDRTYIIAGDFNINVGNSDSENSRILLDIASEFGLRQLVNIPTRVTNTTSSIVDLVFTNAPNQFLVTTLGTQYISDHEVLQMVMLPHIRLWNIVGLLSIPRMLSLEKSNDKKKLELDDENKKQKKQ